MEPVPVPLLDLRTPRGTKHRRRGPLFPPIVPVQGRWRGRRM